MPPGNTDEGPATGTDLTNDPVITRLQAWAASRDDVRALLLTSTRTLPGARLDAFSDYDIIVVVPDIEPFRLHEEWLKEFGPLLVVYRDPIHFEHGFPLFCRVTQYENGLKIDFSVMDLGLLRAFSEQASLPDYLDLGYAILLDKDGITSGLPQPTYKAYIPHPPTEAQYLVAVEEFFHETTYVAKNLWRNELLPMKYSLEFVRQSDFRQMLEWRMEIDHAWSKRLGAHGKWLAQSLPPDIWSRFENTFAGADRSENWQVLFSLIDLYREMATAVGNSLGYTYPDDLHRRVIAYLRRVQSLPPDAARFGG